jgi:hypothetical protein
MLVTGCSKNKTDNDEQKDTTSNIIESTENTETKPEESPETTPIEKFDEPDNTGIEDGALYFGLNGANGESIRLSIPKVLEEHCYPKYSSYFEEGWVKITISAKDENHDMFTIYASSNDSYKQYETEKNYKILCDDGNFVVIWFEHELENIAPEVETSVEMLRQNFTLIQESVIIRALEN